jgi:urease accessory protein
MLLDRILGNVEDPSWPAHKAAGRTIDWFDLHWHECRKRLLRKSTRGGRTLRIVLPPGGVMGHGDVVAIESDCVCAAWLIPIEVIVVRPRDTAEMGELALAIGNLHAPAQVNGDELWVIPDGPVEAAIARLGTPHEIAVRRFIPHSQDGVPTFSASSDFAVRRS